jgi:molybdate transport system permease protein
MALSLCLVSILLSFVVLLASGTASRSLDRK